ncbi:MULTISPECIES: acyltransferase [Enterococcus]|uniref:acyltransferase n=1 Tax=Enterococcus TaxID=1350 RepID=UPI0023A9DD22|nr:acyltransferase [Enterococcus faecium]MDE5173769.1 acyltransferase [Enterococcus faecium]MDQ8230328.1 acyltransferase [Enterococcus faecium]MDQ8251500.1 acyltransferase [Enterococcus faecium]MEB8406642.1 acyltransferase [Enterococcus faecium]
MKERGREKFKRYKIIMSIGIRLYYLLPKRLRIILYRNISDKKGIFRMAQRYMLLKTLAKEVGDNVSIHDHVYLFNLEELIIGNNVSIHPMCYIQASGGVTIGDNVSIAHGVTIMTENHEYKNLLIPIKEQNIYRQEIIIENDVWIGAKATILYGNIIHSGSVIAANAVVTKDVATNCVVAGVPAKVIINRDKV